MSKNLNKDNVIELILYGSFGVLTTIANIFIYQVLLLCVDYKISNLIAIIVTKLLAYVVNKLFVFRSHCSNFRELIKEATRFIITRGLTGLIDYFGLILLVEVFGLNQIYTKYFIQVVVIGLNYIFGKKTVFISNKVNKGKESK